MTPICKLKPQTWSQIFNPSWVKVSYWSKPSILVWLFFSIYLNGSSFLQTNKKGNHLKYMFLIPATAFHPPRWLVSLPFLLSTSHIFAHHCLFLTPIYLSLPFLLISLPIIAISSHHCPSMPSLHITILSISYSMIDYSSQMHFSLAASCHFLFLFIICALCADFQKEIYFCTEQMESDWNHRTSKQTIGKQADT